MEQVEIFPVGNKKLSQIQKQEHHNEQEQQPTDTEMIDQWFVTGTNPVTFEFPNFHKNSFLLA